MDALARRLRQADALRFALPSRRAYRPHEARMIVAILGALVIVALGVAPRLWVMGVLRRHSGQRSDFTRTGGEFAREVLDRMNLTAVKVEETERGDHYH